MDRLILVRYGEIGLKSRPVRNRFENILRTNIEDAFARAGLDCMVSRIPGRLLVDTNHLDQGVDVLTRVFGITSVSPTAPAPAAMEPLLEVALDYARHWRRRNPGAVTFAVRSRRSGSHQYTSQDLARRLGAEVLQDPEAGMGMSVKLKDPDFQLYVDVRGTQAFVHSSVVDGPGGLPMGSAGRVVALIKDRNSAVAAWMMMKRGCTIAPVHFEGLTGRAETAATLHEALTRWNMRARLRTIELPAAATPAGPLACAVCIRGMMRAAAEHAKRRRARVVVTGETLASTTMAHMAIAAPGNDVTILRPLMGLLPTMVNEIAVRLGLPAEPQDRGHEPCPLRTPGAVELAQVEAHEQSTGLVPPEATA